MMIDISYIRYVFHSAFLAVLPVGAAQAAYICVGASPGFVLVIDGEMAQFDLYPGTFYQVNPPVTAPHGNAASTHTLGADDLALSVILTPKSCPVLGATLPFAVDIALPDGAETELITGCCTVMAQ